MFICLLLLRHCSVSSSYSAALGWSSGSKHSRGKYILKAVRGILAEYMPIDKNKQVQTVGMQEIRMKTKYVQTSSQVHALWIFISVM
jgi:hypothetical protein